METTVYKCRHVVCIATQYQEPRSFKHSSHRCRHEKKSHLHKCPQDCVRCEQLGLNNTGRSPSQFHNTKAFPCRHTNCKRQYIRSHDRTYHESHDTHRTEECGEVCEACNIYRKIRKRKCHSCKSTGEAGFQSEQLRKKAIATLEHLSKKLQANEDVNISKDWQTQLLANEPTVLEEAYLVRLPHEESKVESSGIIPFATLNASWRAWWNSISTCIINDQELPSAVTQGLKGLIYILCKYIIASIHVPICRSYAGRVM